MTTIWDSTTSQANLKIAGSKLAPKLYFRTESLSPRLVLPSNQEQLQQTRKFESARGDLRISVAFADSTVACSPSASPDFSNLITRLP